MTDETTGYFRPGLVVVSLVLASVGCAMLALIAWIFSKVIL